MRALTETEAFVSDRETIEIVLATYNGARFLPELLASLEKQTDDNWRLLVRDDNSSDDTAGIIRAWSARFEGRLLLLEDGCGTLGASRNFAELLFRSTALYVACCDQDDVWSPDRLELTRRALAGSERDRGVETPTLVHTDLEVVDSNLRTIAPSLWRYQKLKPANSEDPGRAAVQNGVTGCTILMNRALLDLAMPIPAEAVMHDWWLAIVAAASGVVIGIPERTVRYRQHGGNELGAQGRDLLIIMRRVHRFLDPSELRESVQVSSLQARAFVQRFGQSTPVGTNERLIAWSEILDQTWLSRRAQILRYWLFPTGVLRSLLTLIRL